MKSKSQIPFKSPKKQAKNEIGFDLEQATRIVQKFSDSPVVKRFQNHKKKKVDEGVSGHYLKKLVEAQGHYGKVA